MNAEQFKTIRADAQLTQADLAKRLRVDVRTVRRWEAGDRTIPGPVEVLMEQQIPVRAEPAPQ
jgi:DNA-binding transcriptional regulator YiaG